MNYCLLTPDKQFESGEIFRYNESFGVMPEHRSGSSRCRHYFLGRTSDGEPSIGSYDFVSSAANFADEVLFYAEIGRDHEMTEDEEGWENYDEDFYVYCALLRPDGSRVINIFDTWQIATGDYVSHGYFIKDPSGKTLYEQGFGEEGYEYYVAGEKLPLTRKADGTMETVGELTIDKDTKLCVTIDYWDEWEGRTTVYLVLNIDGKEVKFDLFDFKIYW